LAGALMLVEIFIVGVVVSVFLGLVMEEGGFIIGMLVLFFFYLLYTLLEA
jgi:hypothetical protein